MGRVAALGSQYRSSPRLEILGCRMQWTQKRRSQRRPSYWAMSQEKTSHPVTILRVEVGARIRALDFGVSPATMG